MQNRFLKLGYQNLTKNINEQVGVVGSNRIRFFTLSRSIEINVNIFFDNLLFLTLCFLFCLFYGLNFKT